MQKVDKPYIVYMHIAPNNKRYIGITSQRLNGRFGTNGYGYKCNTYFWRAIQKYGWDNFQHIVLAEGLTQEDACQLEIELIAKYKSNNPNYGYNISFGGNTGSYNRPCSEETKKKISIANSKYVPTEETKQKISKSLKGRKHTEEHNKKVSEALKGKYVGELSSSYGLKRSDETRKRMSESAKLGWEKRRARLNGNK